MLETRADFSTQQYAEMGYTGPIRAFSDAEAAELRRNFYATIGQSENSPGPTKTYMAAWHHQHRWAYDMATSPRILDRIETILGPNIVMWAMHFWYKEPHSGKRIPWHQDAAYWHIMPKKNVSAWIALGPTFFENGCLRIIPGSHRTLLEHQPITDDTSQFSQGLPPEAIDESTAVNLEMQPGEFVIFNEATYHGSEANGSDIARVALSIRYTSPDVKFEIEKWTDAGRIKTFLVRGEDTHHLNDGIRGIRPQ
jgi:ectoine hydroxylase-related dioxygenase (phytanoyl-CoA dioxygenase family)